MRLYQKEDYGQICKWWKMHDFPIIPEEMLPRVGLVIDGKCSVFVYQSDSAIAWMEFLVSNPELSFEERNASVNKIIEGAARMAKELGFSKLFTSTNKDRLVGRLMEHGFVIGDTTTTQLVRNL